MNLKRFLVAVFLLISATQYAQYTDIINSNRPGKSMSAFSVGKTVIQAEAGLYGISEKHDLLRYEANGFGTEIDVRYGAFFDQFEFALIRNISMIGTKRRLWMILVADLSKLRLEPNI